MNTCIFMGRLTRDPEIRYTNDGKAVAKYSLAVDRKYKSDGETSADFFSITAFGKTAEFVEKYLSKGTKILVTAHAQQNDYTDKDGVKHYGVTFIADSHDFCEKASSGGGSNGSQTSKPEPAANGNGFMNIPTGFDDELPFA